MRCFLPMLFVLFAAGLLAGCRSDPILPGAPGGVARETPAGNHTDPATRDNAMTLLEDLLSDEQHLSLILIIKRESPELHRLVKEISQTAGDAVGRLKALAKKYPGPKPGRLDLPRGEMAARAGIAKTKKHLLLSSKGAEFEFQLLLTQAEALSYGVHLARAAAENEPRPECFQVFTTLATQLDQLQERVLSSLRQKSPNTGK